MAASSLLSSWVPKMEGGSLVCRRVSDRAHTMLHMDKWNVNTHLCEKTWSLLVPRKVGCRSGYTTTLGHFYSGDQVLFQRPCSSLMPRCRGLCRVLIDLQRGVSGPANFRRETVSITLSEAEKTGRAVSLLCVCCGDTASLGIWILLHFLRS